MTQGSPDRCIRGFSTEGFAKQADLFLAEPAIGRQARVVRRALFANAYPVEVDAQGRVLVPPPLRRWAGLEGPVVVIGIGEGFEIWSAEDFDQAANAEQDEYAQALEALARVHPPGPV